MWTSHALAVELINTHNRWMELEDAYILPDGFTLDSIQKNIIFFSGPFSFLKL